jgi:DNA-binding transcriptional MerR regulator
VYQIRAFLFRKIIIILGGKKMKFMNKMLAVVLVLALTAVCPVTAFGEDLGGSELTGEDETALEEVEDTTTGEEGTVEGDGTEEEGLGTGKGTQKAWKLERNEIKQQRAEIQALFGEAGDKIEEIEKLLEAAEASGADAAAIDGYKAQIAELKAQMDGYKVQITAKIDEMKQAVRNKYTEEELSEIEEVSETLEETAGVEALPVENILTETDVKFDTPPVIKQGRTLIPVRAITEAMGATVEYDIELQTVTIIKGEKTILLSLADDKVFVNGVESATDVPAEIMNNRTMVPLRFIAENLELKVDWDQETQTVEITDETAETTEETVEETTE